MFLNPFRRYQRYIQISRTLLKYGFSEYIKTVNPWFWLARLGLVKNQVRLRPIPERLRLALEELGPTFIKIGQFASTRNDILPEEITKELSKLQDSVRPVGFSEIKRIIESEIGPISRIFENFNTEPLGSASIAQVYSAQYKGIRVIVKVRRPNIKKIIDLDIQVLKELARIAEHNIPVIKRHKPGELIETFNRMIHREIDLLNEVTNIEKFRENFQNDSRIYIPRVFHELCTSRVLVQEHIDGIKIDDVPKLKTNGNNPKLIARAGADIFLKQILIHGFFHADPHPGNLFIKDNNSLVPVDFGMVGRISPQLKAQMIDFLLGVAEMEPDRITHALLKIGIIENGFETEALKEDIFYVLNKFEGRTLRDISVRDFINDINRVIRKYQIRIPQDLLYLGKALSQIESIGRKLDPDFNTIEFLKNFARENNLGMLSLRDIISKGRWWFRDMLTILVEMPQRLNKFFESRTQPTQEHKPEKEKPSRLYWYLNGFGILTISIFLYFIAPLPILKFLALFGIFIAFIIFLIQIFISFFA